MSDFRHGRARACLLGVLLTLVILAGCGSNFPATGTQQAGAPS